MTKEDLMLKETFGQSLKNKEGVNRKCFEIVRQQEEGDGNENDLSC